METWVFVDPQKCGWVLRGRAAATKLDAIREECGGAEDINEDPATAPSKRVVSVVSSYQKTFHGPLAIGEVGMS